MFPTFTSATQANPRPLMLTEWGAPASTHNSQGDITNMSDEQMKNLCNYVSGHYQNMLDNSFDSKSASAVCCGGAHFEWTDEWWKADPIPCNAPNAASACYAGVWNAGPTMSPVGNFPGNYWDEEGFGLNAIAPVCPKTRVPPVKDGCVGPWDPTTNSPYLPDVLTARDHAKTLFKLFAANQAGVS